jgi:hypothetical protein
MGTNYYLKWPETRCSACGELTGIGKRGEEHIGKSSAGWHFSLNVTQHKDRAAWEKAIKECLAAGGSIVDEYGGALTEADFWSWVDRLRDSKHCHAREYPSDDVRCVDNVELCAYNFS